MIYIKKNKEPNPLVQHRARQFSSYNNIPTATKEQLKGTLLMEQGYICCYCMKRIKKTDMKIEHWKPQKDYPEKSLDYKNMLGACKGNEKKPKYLQCCDSHKGDLVLSINPLSSNCETFIKYLNNGTIKSDDERIDYDLNKILNLNLQSIKNNRSVIIDVIVRRLKSNHSKRQWTKAIIQKEINNWTKKDADGKLKEFYGVGLFFLKKLYQKATV